VFYLSAQPASSATAPTETTTSRNAARAANTSRPSSPSHDAAPVCCGRPPTRRPGLRPHTGHHTAG